MTRTSGSGVVAALTVSGLASDEDHQLGVEGTSTRTYVTSVSA
ncbi:heme-binding protein [Arthrobacter sp. PsM3]|nr:heme-binding protein [Arthrobacter sp. PsM3]MDN4645634.1 heme-binding protein [Arthrobacter sp. PsM3]